MAGLPILPVLAVLLSQTGTGEPVIDFPCFKNLSDGRVLVDGAQWDAKLKELGYELKDGAYVPYEVLAFELQAKRDEVWADGLCRLQLLPPQE